MLDARVQIRRTRLLMGIAEGTAGVLQRHPQLAGMAHELATEFVALLAGNFSDSTLTIPKDCNYLAHKRKRGLLREFNGRNHSDVARKYGYRVTTVYDVVKRARELPAEVPRAELMVEVVTYIAHLVAKHGGLAADAAEGIGHEVADFIAEHFGGILLALSGRYHYGNAVRDVLLLEALEDGRLDEQAEALGLSQEAVAKVLAGYRNLPEARTPCAAQA
jgi:Mor family transcriptional regulator